MISMNSSSILTTLSLFQSCPGRGTNSLMAISGWGARVGGRVCVGFGVGVRVRVGATVDVGGSVGLPQTANGLEEFWGSLGARRIKSAALLFESTQLPKAVDLRS